MSSKKYVFALGQVSGPWGEGECESQHNQEIGGWWTAKKQHGGHKFSERTYRHHSDVVVLRDGLSICAFPLTSTNILFYFCSFIFFLWNLMLINHRKKNDITGELEFPPQFQSASVSVDVDLALKKKTKPQIHTSLTLTVRNRGTKQNVTWSQGQELDDGTQPWLSFPLTLQMRQAPDLCLAQERVGQLDLGVVQNIKMFASFGQGDVQLFLEATRVKITIPSAAASNKVKHPNAF